MPRVFILGAGFSKQAGMPLADELTSRILDKTELRELEELQEWVNDLRQRLAKLEGAGKDASRFRLNVEQLFDYAMYDGELYRMNQQLSRVGRDYGDTPWEKAESVSTWLEYLRELLAVVIWEDQKRANLEPLKRFTDCLSDEDTVVSFNYDTLVEDALSARRQTWNHGLNDSDGGGVTVLKMHGSINWIMLTRRPEVRLDKFTKLFSKRDHNVNNHGLRAPKEPEYALELWRANDKETLNAVIDMDKNGLSNFEYYIGLAGLGRYKPLHELLGCGKTWQAAFKALREADEIYVIGFSMSPYDTMARFHFTSVLCDRANPLKRAVVVDPNAVRSADNYHDVFGSPLTLVAETAEGVDWRKLFA